MPYTFKKNPKGGIDILKAGKKVAHSDTLSGAKGYAWHAKQGHKKKGK